MFLRKIFFYFILLGITLKFGVFNAHGDAGHAHGNQTPQSLPVSNSSKEIRLAKTGKVFELVLKISTSEKKAITAYITDPESNLPISDAVLTINPTSETPLNLIKANQKGVYSSPFEGLENSINLLVKKENFEESFLFENISFTSNQESVFFSLYFYLSMIALLGAIAFFLRKKLKCSKHKLLSVFHLLLFLAANTSYVFAHVGEDHNSQKKKEEGHQVEGKGESHVVNQSPSGIIVPKELQLHLNITTEKAIERSLGKTIRLMGHVISDPSGYARLQATQNARILNDPESPLPLPGQKVQKDQVILSLQPTLGKTETSDQKTVLYKIESEIIQLRKDVERKEKLGQYAVKKDLDNAKTELERSIKQKEEIINKTFKPEYLRSPLEGIISDLHVRHGEIVTPDKTIVEIVDPSKLMIEALLFDSTLSDEIVKGFARLPLYPDKNLPLEILGVSPKVNKEDQAIHILFKAKDSDPSIKLDMVIEVMAELKSSKPTLTIPKNAIIEDRTGTWVFVKINPETFEPRKVRVNQYIEQYAEIIDGIRSGEIIVINGAYLLQHAK